MESARKKKDERAKIIPRRNVKITTQPQNIHRQIHTSACRTKANWNKFGTRKRITNTYSNQQNKNNLAQLQHMHNRYNLLPELRKCKADVCGTV